MTDTTHRITYRGNPALAGLLASMLKDEGARVEWERPLERRDVQSMAEAVVVTLTAQGAAASIRFAVDKFRSRMKGQADTTVEDQDE